jgi:drug/metabolite transporter (DMT)-like permease
MWALLALLTIAAGPIPPFQLTAMCLTLAGVLGLAWIAASPSGFSRLHGLPPAVWAIGIGSLFGYHVLYFVALGLAPPAQASLVAYTWPVLMVLFSGLLPGEQVRRGHFFGVAIAFAGAAIVVLGGDAQFRIDHIPGLSAAFACALIWSGYSVMSRRMGGAPTESVAIFCVAAALLSTGAHFAFERTVWPERAAAWAAILALGAGPVGFAFFLWDIGCKRGNIQLLGVCAYAAPLLSTLALVAVGYAQPSRILLLSAALITGGAIIAARAAPPRTTRS